MGGLYYQDDVTKLYSSDCRNMSELEDASIQVVVTSPPYWGLRKYAGLPDLVWGGKDDCQHDFSLSTSAIQGNNSMVRGKDETDSGNFAIPKFKDTDMKQRKEVVGAFCSLCGAWRGQLGLEPTPELYIAHLVDIFREVGRVLRKDGVCFVNIGDSYSGGHRKSNPNQGFDRGKDTGHAIDYTPSRDLYHDSIKPKDLCLIPFRLAIVLQADKWWVRSVIIWSKNNPMPESVRSSRWERHKFKINSKKLTKIIGGVEHWNSGGVNLCETEYQDCPGCPKCKDGYILVKGSWRPTESHEYVLMLTKSGDYYTDQEAVREKYTEPLNRWGGPEFGESSHKYIELGGHDGEQHYGATSMFRKGRPVRPIEIGRNLRSVWEFPTQPYKLSHFATYPEELVRRCILAATPEIGCCPKCGKPWVRLVEKQLIPQANRQPNHKENWHSWEVMGTNEVKTIGWKPQCKCELPQSEKVGSTVLDPFAGSGTTLAVAKRLGRRAVGYELSEKYCQLAVKRIEAETAPMGLE